MQSNEEFPEVSRRLKAIIEPYADRMRVNADPDIAYSLDTRHVMKNDQPLFSWSIAIRKNYVSFYLMPVYVFPDLLDEVGDLRARMQGKSSFYF